MQNNIDCSLKGKRILFFPTYTYGYENHIKEAMEELGAKVDVFDERPDETFLTRALIRINRNLMARKINRYHESILEKTKDNEYDFVFFIRCEAFGKSTINKIKILHPESKLIIYFWDSFKYNKNSIRVKDLADKVFTFDREDSIKYNIPHLSLFYIDKYSAIPLVDKFTYKTLFIGSLYSDRYPVIRKIEALMPSQTKKFSYFYVPSKILFWKMKLTDKDVRPVKYISVKFKALKLDEILKLFEESEIIIDVQGPLQSGLTMRTVETIGARRKLITTNADIRNYDFYDDNNILIVDRNNVVIPDSFINTPFKPLPDEIYDKYSLSSWLKTIFAE